MRSPSLHLMNAYVCNPPFYASYSASPARFKISAVILIALAARVQSFFSTASLMNGYTELSSPFSASGAKMACLNCVRPGNYSFISIEVRICESGIG